MKVMLSVPDRLNAQGLLPLKASNFNKKLIREAKEILSFNDGELKLLEIQEVGTQIRWSSAGEKEIGEVEIELGPYAAGKIAEALKALDKAEDLTDTQDNLYEKFVNNKEQLT